MSHTLTIRLDDDLAAWLEETARRRGTSQSRLVREQIELARAWGSTPSQAFMRWAGAVSGPADLSSCKGFTKPR
jgi:predicted transcriptional regulator